MSSWPSPLLSSFVWSGVQEDLDRLALVRGLVAGGGLLQRRSMGE